MWLDLLYGLLWVVTVFSVIFTFILARQIRSHSDMPIEQLFLLTFGLLFGIVMMFFFLDGQLHKTDHGDEQGAVKMAHYEFVKQIYPPLIAVQTKLVHQIARLSDLQKQVLKLRGKHPQQADRLQFAQTQWLSKRKDLNQIKVQLDKGVRAAWLQHKTQNKQVIASTFNKHAVDWGKFISDRLAQLQDSQLKVNNAMLDNVMLQNRNLSRLGRDKKVGFATRATALRSIFSTETTRILLEYFDGISPELAEMFGEMGKEINIASQRRREVRNYALGNPDLKQALNKVMENWLQLENKAIYYRDQVLHAIQSRYLAVILGTNKRDNQIVRLNKALKIKIPQLYAELLKSRESLEKSYKTGPR